MKKKLVIAGDYRQFKDWFMFMKGIKYYENSQYIGSIDKLYGQDFQKSELILVGEYWRSPVFNHKRFAVLSKKFIVVKPPNTNYEPLL